MKVVILAGGAGTRLAEETVTKPKGMVEIGGRPLLWHIMKHYEQYGFHDFVIALGYKGDVIKRYMLDYYTMSSNLRIDTQTGRVDILDQNRPSWQVELIDTGLHTQTGGRIKRLAPYLGNEPFMLTWSDGVSNINLQDLLAFHRSHGKLATLTAVYPVARFGYLDLVNNTVAAFHEKLQTREGWINGAFFVLEPGIFDYIDDDETSWEHVAMARLAEAGELMAYRHTSFWRCMDTLHDKRTLEQIWQTGNAPWKVWEE
jgi:glucose-1-phosphate cytidylyltransferase